MGNTGSLQQIASAAVHRDPLYDGASGLNYSGRIYTNSFKAAADPNFCNGVTVSPDQIKDVYSNGVSTISLPNENGQTALQSYVTGLVNSGRVPGERSDGNIDQQIKDDMAFYTGIQAEYCFYESRYKAALDQFLTLVSAPTGSDSASVTAALTTTIELNARLNSLLEILNYVSNDRAQKVNARSPQIDAANSGLQKRIGILKKQHDYLSSSDVRTRTQEEMMRYSAEKNQAMSVQIMFFMALNVVALGTIFTVYKNM